MSHVNVFSKTSDTKTIIRFLKEIEKHPCLYDPKSPQYIDRELKRKTWIYIAKKANSTVADCKEKWTKIRTAYIRTLRPSYNDGIRTFGRPYYLASHLKFIMPMKRNGKKNSEYRSLENTRQEKIDKEIETKAEEEQSDDDSDDHSSSQDGKSQHEVFLDEDDNSYEGNDEDIMGYDNIVIDKEDTNEANKKKVKEASKSNEHNSGRVEKRKTCNENFIDCNPRKMFIFSLLPDIEHLNEEQMRFFRREVIKLIDKVMVD